MQFANKKRAGPADPAKLGAFDNGDDALIVGRDRRNACASAYRYSIFSAAAVSARTRLQVSTSSIRDIP
jgi:hypothetical protein